jgi:hypothetical protein
LSVIIKYEMPIAQMKAEIEAIRRKTEAGLNAAVDELLDYAGKVQVESYTSAANPTKPPGSNYQRTFNLQRASSKVRLGKTMPNISGRWYVNEGIAAYGKYVVGKRRQQASIHRGRWKSLEEIEAAVKEKAPQAMERHLK